MNEQSETLYKEFEIKFVYAFRQDDPSTVKDIVERFRDDFAIYGVTGIMLGYSVVGEEKDNLTIDAAKKILESVDDPQKVIFK